MVQHMAVQLAVSNFPETRPANYNLRPRAHEFKLPLMDDRNYVQCLLFKVLGRIIMF